jgi:tetratricopeptide (TPR) repeat protein
MKDTRIAIAVARALASVGLTVCFLAAPTWGGDYQQATGTAGAGTERLGTVRFPTSCSPVSQQHFERGVALLHSFHYPDDIAAFKAAAEADPQCAIAYWGIAIGQRPNPLVGPFTAEALNRGLEAVNKGKAIGARTERERDWLNAIELFYKDFDKIDQDTRTLAYEKAMGELYLKYPDDTEAAVFYALALNETASHSDKTYANQLKATATLEKIDAIQPDHPGVTHYLIHSYDYAPIANRGLAAADKYAKVAPSVPHARHMPSHIYSMLGLWQKSVESNQSAVDASKEIGATTWPGTGKIHPQALHAWDFMEYAYLQMGQDRRAREVVGEIGAAKPAFLAILGAYTALSAVPARYALERGAWKEAALLEPQGSSAAPAEALTYFARALGAARSGDAPAAKRAIDKLKELRASLEKSNQTYWAEQVEVQVLGASAWAAHAEGKQQEALKLMRAAADLEDSSEKHVAMENRLYPMRELLGELLLELKQPKAALKEFETSLNLAPNRLRGFSGAAKAAALANDRKKAAMYYAKLVELTKNADTDRPEIQEAKRYLAMK